MAKLNFATQTEPAHAFATEAFDWKVEKEGNLMKASASLHVLEDSYAHAGTTAEQGHAFIWHWPDRPFGRPPDKYSDMVRRVFEALVAIRSQLPPGALDTNLKSVGDSPNYQLDALHAGQKLFC